MIQSKHSQVASASNADIALGARPTRSALTGAQNTDSTAVAVIWAQTRRQRAIIASPEFVANTFHASLNGDAPTVRRTVAIIRALQLFGAADTAPARLADADIVATAHTVLQAALSMASWSLRAVFAEIERVTEAFAIEALTVVGATGRALSRLLASRAMEARVAETFASIANTTPMTIVLARHIDLTRCARISRVANALSLSTCMLAARATTVALIRALAETHSSQLGVTSVGAIDAGVRRHAVTLAKDTNTAEVALVGAWHTFHHVATIDTIDAG